MAVWLAAVLPANTQPNKDFISMPRAAPSIGAALAALPETGTIFVTAEAKTAPGFVAVGFKDLTIGLNRRGPIAGSATAIFSMCANVALLCSNDRTDATRP